MAADSGETAKGKEGVRWEMAEPAMLESGQDFWALTVPLDAEGE